MPIAWLPTRWWDWRTPEDEKQRARRVVRMIRVTAHF